MLAIPRLRALAALLLGLWLCGTAAARDIVYMDACECKECLKLFQASMLAERKAYADRLPTAMQELNKKFIRWQLDESYRLKYEKAGNILFCDLWETLRDELDVVRELEIPKIQKKIFAGKESCHPHVSARTNPMTCEIDDAAMVVIEVTSPCPAVHLAILAHELVHVEDCKNRAFKPDWKTAEGKTCAKAYAGKKTPPPQQMLTWANEMFKAELHAHEVEGQVLRLLRQELDKQCRRDDDSNRPAGDLPEATKFLERARTYEYKL